MCRNCFLEYRKQYRKNNPEQDRKYKEKNKDKIEEYSKSYYKANKPKCDAQNIKNYYEKYKEDGRTVEYSRKYRSLHREQLNEYARNKYREKRKNDLCFRLNSNISRNIRYTLKANGSFKGGKSCKDYLSFSINELKTHLESLFEPWMNWDNYGSYRVDSWNDDDRCTWTWNIDHIISQSKLPYTSMEDENFKKCWSLQNLRPFSSKLNLIKGNK